MWPYCKGGHIAEGGHIAHGGHIAQGGHIGQGGQIVALLQRTPYCKGWPHRAGWRPCTGWPYCTGWPHCGLIAQDALLQRVATLRRVATLHRWPRRTGGLLHTACMGCGRTQEPNNGPCHMPGARLYMCLHTCILHARKSWATSPPHMPVRVLFRAGMWREMCVCNGNILVMATY